MIINYISLENFKTFRHKTKFDLEVKNRDQNIVLIEALNGVGKTSLLEAIRIAFFGISKTLFEKYISYGSEDKIMVIELEFYNTNNYKTYKVHREYSYNVNKTQMHSELSVFIEKVKQLSYDENKWRLILQSEFPEEISNFFFFDGEKVQQIIDYKNPREIKLAIEKILGIEEVRNLKDGLTQIRSNRIRKYGVEKKDIRTKTLDLQLNDVIENKKLLQNEIKEKNKKIELISREIIKVKTDIDSLLASGLSENKLESWKNLKDTISKLETQRILIENQIKIFLNKNLDTFLIKNSIESLNKDKLNNNEKKPLIIEDIMVIVKELFYPKCECCDKEFDKLKFTKVERKLERIVNEWNSKTNDNINSEDFLTSIKTIESIEFPDLISLIEQQDEIDIQQSELNHEINSLERINNSENQLIQLQEQRNKEVGLTGDKASLEHEVLNHIENLNLVEKKISEIEFELESYMKTSEIEKVERDSIDLVGNIISALEEYISELSVEKRHQLKENTQKMFTMLSNTELYSNVEIDDNYKISLFDRDGKEHTDLSSGFKQILMTSLIWGLKECSEKNLPIIIDTPLARLDPVHRKNMMEKYFPSAAPQVIILSQPSEITSSDLNNKNWNQHLKNRSYFQMNLDPESKSTIIENISINN